MAALLIGAACGLILGVFTARVSAQRQAIKGGWPPQVFHYFGAACITGALPAGLAGIVLGNGFVQAAALGLGFTLIGFAALVICAIFERQI